MPSYYINQQLTDTGLGSNAAPLTLTGAEQKGDIFETKGAPQLVFYIQYIPGENNATIDFRLKGVDDNSEEYEKQRGESATGSGRTKVTTYFDDVYQLEGVASGTTYRFRISIPIADKRTRVSILETATVAGTVHVQKVISGI